jgi:hypothetical protein
MIWRVTGFHPTTTISPQLALQGPIALAVSGPLISVVIMPPPPIQSMLTAQGKPHPGVPVVALIDTGASITAVSPSIVQRANLQFTGYHPIQGVNNQSNCPVFLVKYISLGEE